MVDLDASEPAGVVMVLFTLAAHHDLAEDAAALVDAMDEFPLKCTVMGLAGLAGGLARRLSIASGKTLDEVVSDIGARAVPIIEQLERGEW